MYHINCLKANPHMVIDLLEIVKCDKSRYVQNAVGNWLNNASKYQPEWIWKIRIIGVNLLIVKKQNIY